ncbi:MAG: ABC transporter ATP-binding protein [Oscillibacter sp.]|nr:ABC transporter ATP-binding protein [Oscillibacter sp.]
METMKRETATENQDIAISVRDITKSFKVYYDKGVSLKDKLLFRGRGRYENHQVLRGVSFDVKRGEAIGLIGQNGCGKSTTLKMLTQIMYPDSGTITMKGRVSALIELGAGFHPDMSGRENIYTNAAIFGLTRKEVDACVEEIIAFSELGEYIDNPVRTYSSGMYMRLAFSVAINVNADILLVDEILAVGDAAFQAKCFNKMREIKAEGTTIVIVSHSLGQIEQMCERSYWIDKGVVRKSGIPREVHAEYLAFMGEKSAENRAETEAAEKNAAQGGKDDKRWGSREAVMESVEMLDEQGRATNCFHSGDAATVRIRYKAAGKLSDVVVGLAVYRSDQTYMFGTNTMIDHLGYAVMEGEGLVELHMQDLALISGQYTLDLAFHKPDGFAYDFWREACTLQIISDKEESGAVSLKHEWTFH